VLPPSSESEFHLKRLFSLVERHEHLIYELPIDLYPLRVDEQLLPVDGLCRRFLGLVELSLGFGF